MAGFFDPTDPTAGGLMSGFAPQQGTPGMMGMLANPQTAGLLGMAGGLLSAAGPSRLPVTNGQAMGAGFQGMQQGIGNAMQNQRALLTMQAMQGLLGGSPTNAPQSPSAAQGAPVTGAANVGAMSGPSAGMGSYAGAGSAPVNPNDVAPQSPSIFGRTPQQLWQQGMMMNLAGIQGGADMMKMAAQYDPSLQAQLPTDITKMGVQGGLTPAQIQAANAAAVQKNNSMTYRPGAGIATFGPNGPQFTTTPGANGVIQVQDPSSPTGWRTMVNPGASDVIQQQAASEAAGKAQFKVQQVWEPTANNGQGGFVNQTVANIANAANGGNVPLGIQNNNFGNIRTPDGKGFVSYGSPQEGVNAADNLLANYGSKYGINTLTGIANRWSPKGDGNNDPVAKAAAMSTSIGIPVNQPINLADPAVRSQILPALFDTETPGWRNAIGGQSQGVSPQRSGPMAAQPPVGYTPATNAAQTAASKQMADSYQGLASTDSNYQQSRNALNDMLALSNRQGAFDKASSFLPYDWSTKVDSDAAQYAKAHSTFIAQQGSALGAGGTDQARGTIEESVPTYDKPLSARTAGLNMQLNNLDYRHLETQIMTPSFQTGDQKGYTTLNAQFHNTVKPEMMPTIMPIMQMSGPQQQAAVQAAVKANPAMKPAFEMMFNAGMLK